MQPAIASIGRPMGNSYKIFLVKITQLILLKKSQVVYIKGTNYRNIII